MVAPRCPARGPGVRTGRQGSPRPATSSPARNCISSGALGQGAPQAMAIRGWAAPTPCDLRETGENGLAGFRSGAGAGTIGVAGASGGRMQGRPRTALPGLVGRDGELGELLAGLDDAAAGTGRLFLLAGDPGIG